MKLQTVKKLSSLFLSHTLSLTLLSTHQEMFVCLDANDYKLVITNDWPSVCVCVRISVDSGPPEHLLYSTAHPHRALHYRLAQRVCQRCRCHIKVMCLIINSTKGTALFTRTRNTQSQAFSATARSSAEKGLLPKGWSVCLTVCVCVCVHVSFVCMLEEKWAFKGRSLVAFNF